MTLDDDALPPPCPTCGSLARKSDGTCASCGGEIPDDAPTIGGADDDGAQDPLIGSVVVGRFEVKSLLGVGGAGRVYLAHQLGLDRPVALKLMHQHLALQEEQKARFHREARAASRITHPGAVTVYDFGVWEGQLYIALEFLPGRSLAELLDAEYPLGDHRVVNILGKVADVLTEAHRLGVLHRDLKPENVMVSQGADGEEVVKVVDFGLAILYGPQTEAKLTQEGVISGTPAYMSPEQIRGEELDPQSDLYSLGVMLYEMISGEVPFSGQNVTDILIGHMFHPPPPPSDVETETAVHPQLEELALRTLSKNRFERPQTVGEFRQALTDALEQPRATPSRTDSKKKQDRSARADAAGLRRPPSPTQIQRPVTQKQQVFVILEPDGRAAGSLSTLLQANGHLVEVTNRLDDVLLQVRSLDPAAVVVDLGDDPTGLLQALSGRLSKGRLSGKDVVIVGPEDDMELMTSALNLGLSNYVPKSVVGEKLPKIIARILRRLRRKNPHTA